MRLEKNAAVGFEVRDPRGRQWTLKDEQGSSSIHFNCHKVVLLLTFTPVFSFCSFFLFVFFLLCSRRHSSCAGCIYL